MVRHLALHPLRRIALGGASLLVLAGLAACGSNDDTSTATERGGSAPADAPLVVVSTTQLADFARIVGSDAIEVYSLLTPNSDAHDFDPAPRDIEALARAAVIVRNGLELDPWLDAAVEASGTDVEVVDASEGARLLEGGHNHSEDGHSEDGHDDHGHDDHGHDHGDETKEDDHGHSHSHSDETKEDDHSHSHSDETEEDDHTQTDEATDTEATDTEAKDDDHGHDHGEFDPHLWFDPANAKVMVSNLADAIVDAAPAAEADIREREAAYLAELDELDAWIEGELEPLENRKLVTDHEALTYYIDRYDLEFVGSVIPSFDSAAEVSSAALADLAKKIEDAGVTAIFTEQSLPPRGAETLARQTGVKVVSGDDGLYGDSLGPKGSPGETYVGMMRHNTTSIVDNLS
jgi:ABC-type Zn uptake system ZnuABC Zn-binding protein ZnuA